ncbi:MAG: preprotein translocase subunit SecE [Chloroflexota bacterium]
MAQKRTAKKSIAKKPSKKAPQKQSRGIGLFYRETIGELKKVSWPTRSEAINLTKVVIVVMIIMSIFLGGLDQAFYRFFEIVFAL